MILKTTLVFFAVVTALLAVGFVSQSEWIFPLLAAVNFLAGPVVLVAWLGSLKRRT